MKDSFGARLRQIRKGTGLSQHAFGERLHISLPTANRQEQRQSYHDEFLLNLIREFNVNLNWLLTGHGNESGAAGVPVYESLANGQGEPSVIGRLSLPDTPEHARAVRVAGDDLLPTIRAGDYVIYVDGPSKEGDVVLYRQEWGEARVRRFTGGQLYAEHPDYPPLPVDRVNVVGRVIQVVRHTAIASL